jgi:hypothetical protein
VLTAALTSFGDGTLFARGRRSAASARVTFQVQTNVVCLTIEVDHSEAIGFDCLRWDNHTSR